ncbi:ATP-binding cassette domain-containing protein [Sphingorhabdus sp. Alg239-R122]|uniref:ATP-binding cassette domain-containing protein n=1 Tax=Sphingorhabdus sp. Alg239-R122 TaxID=2305989 RepID=UPI0013D9332A|nr:ATP-binding cassette domain-containing protein [Sphingorhabdus sp. Alg239-R122]
MPDTLLKKRGPSLEFIGLSRHYGNVVAVDNISQHIEPGEFIALVGASGSGKSTLLKMVNRLIEPTSGQVEIGGEDVTTHEVHELRRSIGYVFQNIGLFPHMDIAHNIAIGSRIGSRPVLPTGEITELLKLVDLPTEMASRMPDQLSGGQQQRVGVARALSTKPGLMLMDEPFGALDPITRENLATSYRALHDRLGLTTIMVTHDMAKALLIADRIWVMSAGKIAADASPAQLLAGGYGDEAESLVAVPRGQAERLLARKADG